MFFRQSDISNKKKSPRQGCWSQKSGVGMHLRSQNLEIQGGKTIRGKKDQKILNCENLPFAKYVPSFHGLSPTQCGSMYVLSVGMCIFILAKSVRCGFVFHTCDGLPMANYYSEWLQMPDSGREDDRDHGPLRPLPACMGMIFGTAAGLRRSAPPCKV